MRKLAVLVPWDSPFMYTEVGFNMMNLKYPEGWEVRFFSGSGWCPAARHNNALARGINWGANALMFLGADHHVDEDILIKLLAHLEDGWDMATGWIPSRGVFGEGRELVFPNMAFVMPDIDRFVPEGPVGSLELESSEAALLCDDDTPSQEIHMIGTGSLMFKVEVVLDMKMPWFQEIIKKDGLYGRQCIQDSHFVYRCVVENGFKLYLDTTIEQKHVMVFPIDKSYKKRFADKAGDRWNPMMGLNTTQEETGMDKDGTGPITEQKILRGEKMDLTTDLPTKDEIIEFYNSRLDNKKTAYHKRVHIGLDRLLSRPKSTALDLGCGTGVNALYMARQGYRVTAVDFADKVIEYAEAESNNRNITYICEDILDLRTQQKYEVIVATDVINRLDPARIGHFLETVLAHAHSRTTVYITLPISYFAEFAHNRQEFNHHIIESRIPLSMVIAMFDRAGFVPMGVETFGTIAPVEHWEIIFITKMHMYDVWREIFETNDPASLKEEVFFQNKQEGEDD